jgi:hypothetical protein
MATGTLVQVHVNADEVKRLLDPKKIEAAQKKIIERAVAVITPIMKAEAPSKTGQAREQITGLVFWSGKGFVGKVAPSVKAFYLRILGAGRRGYTIRPTRFASQRRATRASRSLGPARSRGAIQALRFQYNGQYIFRKLARIPQRAADPFHERAATRSDAPVGAAADQILIEVLR